MSCNDPGSLQRWCAGIPGETPEQRRSELLWLYLRAKLDPAMARAIGDHMRLCGGCRDALESERLLLDARDSTAVTAFAVCPSAEELLQYAEFEAGLLSGTSPGPWRRLEIKRHVERCPLCSEEAGWAASKVAETGGRRAPGADRALAGSAESEWSHRRLSGLRWGWIGAAAAAAVLVFSLVSQFGMRFERSTLARFAHMPDVPYDTIAAEFTAAHPDDLPRFREATELVSLGEYKRGREILGDLEKRYPSDPSVLFFEGYIAAREERWQDAKRLCTEAEPSTLDGYRCWYLANVALMAGDKDLAIKEAHHASFHRPYQSLAERLLKELG